MTLHTFRVQRSIVDEAEALGIDIPELLRQALRRAIERVKSPKAED